MLLSIIILIITRIHILHTDHHYHYCHYYHHVLSHSALGTCDNCEWWLKNGCKDPLFIDYTVLNWRHMTVFSTDMAHIRDAYKC